MGTLTMAPIAAQVTPMEPPSTAPKPDEAKPKKRSTVRHTRAIQRDRNKRPLSAPPAEAVVARLTEIVQPAALAQVSYFHRPGVTRPHLDLAGDGRVGPELVVAADRQH